MSWSSKWKLIQGKTGISEKDAHARYLSDVFRRHIFAPDELQAQADGAVKGFLADLDRLENQLLIQLRADLADGDLSTGALGGVLRRDESILKAFHGVESATLEQLEADAIGYDMVKELSSWIAMDIGAQVGTQLAVDAGILGAGGASAPETLGIGLAAAFAADFAYNKALSLAGLDPVEVVGNRVRNSVNNMRDLMLSGDGAACKEYNALVEGEQTIGLRLLQDDPIKQIEQEKKQLERSGKLGLDWELRSIRAQRQHLLKEALRKVLPQIKIS
jgi:hypothetical protein